MLQVECKVREVQMVTPNGSVTAGLCLECPRCERVVRVYGTSESSSKRGLAIMRKACRKGEKNFYLDGRTATGQAGVTSARQ